MNKLLEGTKKELNQAIPGLQFYQKRVETAVSLVPTGPARNALCDANIHLLEALKHLEKVKETLDAK